MKFLVDAQLPRRLISRLHEAGHEALHTLDLPNGNRTTDTEINDLSEREQRVVVTKDADFVTSFYLSGKPYKLLLISTGNISNVALDALFVPNIPVITNEFDVHRFIELTDTAVIVHA
jgi:predicted nuclease of predicted toxin-antitoxin system